MRSRKVQPTPKDTEGSYKPEPLPEPGPRGAGRQGQLCPAWRLTCITIPSLTFSLQPSHLRTPLTFPPSHHRLLLLRFPLEALPHLHAPPLPPGSHLHPASSLSAPARASSLPAHASIPGPPWSQSPVPSTWAPRPCISEHPACRLLHPFWQLLPPGLGRTGVPAPPQGPPAPPGTSEAGPPHPGTSPPLLLLTFPPCRFLSAPLRPEAYNEGLSSAPRSPPELPSPVCSLAELEGGAEARRALISCSLDLDQTFGRFSPLTSFSAYLGLGCEALRGEESWGGGLELLPARQHQSCAGKEGRAMSQISWPHPGT